MKLADICNKKKTDLINEEVGMKKITIAIVTTIFLSHVFAGTIDPAVPDGKYVEYGKKYECVLPIAGIFGDKLNTQFKATCVVIDEYYILTSAHVVENTITQHVIFEGKAYPCVLVATHALHSNKKGQHDIALARLQRPIKLDYYPPLYSERDEVGKVCGLAGYGNRGDFNSGYNVNGFDNQRRAGSNIIDSVEDNVLTYSVNGKNRTELEFMIAPGDSGGGLFIDQKIAGIHSYVYATDGKADSDYGDVGCSTRISDYIEWIERTKNTIETILKEARK